MVQLARKIIKNSFFNSGRALVSGIGGLAFSVALARFLTPELFGIYALAMSVCFSILQLDPGMGYTLIRYVSYALGKDDFAAARGYFRYLLKMRFIFGGSASILLFIFAGPVSNRVFHKPELFIPLEILSVFTFFFYFSDFLDSCFSAFHEFKYPTIRHLIYESTKFALAVPFALIGYLSGVFFGIAIASVITFIVMFSILWKRYQVIIRGESTKIEKQRVLRFLSFLTIGSISGMFFGYVDMIMIGMFLPAEYAGYYKAATNIIFGIAGLIAISNVLFPMFTQLEGESMENAFKKVFRYSSIMAFPFAASLAFFSGQIIEVVYGAEYSPAGLLLIILSPIIIINSVDFFSVLFGAKDKPEYVAVVSVVTMVINVVLNYVLILSIGMVGAAIASTTSRLFSIIAIAILSRKILNMGPEISSIYKPLTATLAMFGFFYSFPKPEALIVGVLELIVALIIYFSVLFLIKGIRKEDLRYALAIVGIERV